MKRFLGALAAVLFLVACEDDVDSLTAPSRCVNIAGVYTGTISNSCGFTASGPVTVTQTVCGYTATFPNAGGPAITGNLTLATNAFTVAFSVPCGASAAGAATVGPGSITGTFAGPAAGSACCSPLTGSFTLTR